MRYFKCEPRITQLNGSTHRVDLNVRQPELRVEIVPVLPEPRRDPSCPVNVSVSPRPVALPCADDCEHEIHRTQQGQLLWGAGDRLYPRGHDGHGGFRYLLGLLHVLLPHEGVSHTEQARNHLQRLSRQLGRLQGAVCCDPSGVCLILSGETGCATW
ncbi:protein of unknown function [Streptomyces murinus]